ncbi:MAG: alpha/beta fold hydrolase [Bacteroidota bacterium]
MKNIWLSCCLFALGTLPLSAQSILGDWHGVLEIQGMELGIVLHIAEEDGTYTTTMDSPDQQAYGIGTDMTLFEENELTIEAGKLRMLYIATLEGDKLKGTFTQNGMEFPLEMGREAVEKAPVVRPQEPTEFPYVVEDVRFQNPKGDHYLAGTLTMPEDGKFNKVAVLVSGSGPQDRNEELLNHKPFLVLSDYLTRHGIAVLRYDDRGVGESEGDFGSATSKDFADDASAAVNFLLEMDGMEGKQIGIVGHSEGGMIAPIVATENEHVDFIVLLAGPGINIIDLMLLQNQRISEAEGVGQETIEKNLSISRSAFEYVKKNHEQETEELKENLATIFKEGLSKFSEEELAEMGDEEAVVKNQVNTLTSPWFLYFMRFNPQKYLRSVDCPTLAINGELDLQVTAKENIEGIKASMRGNKNLTVKIFPKLNHLFQVTETGAPSEYAKLEETFNEEAMSFVSDWILTYDEK